jgi:hypothetical protein
MKNIPLFIFFLTQLSCFGQGPVNCSLLKVTDLIINNTNLTVDFAIYNGDTMDSHYPFVAYTIDNNGDTIQNGQINWFVTPASDTSWYNYSIPASISPAYPLTVYFVYSNLTGTNPGSDTCILYFSPSISSISISESPLLKIFPNPSSDFITIEFSGLNTASVILTDVLGRVVFINRFRTNNLVLNLKKLKSRGTYFAEIIDSEGNIIAVKKLVYQ